MSFGDTFKCDIYLSHMTIQSKSHLEELIKDRELYLASVRDKILMYASCNPKDVVPKDWEEESINFIYNKVNELLKEYDESYTELINFNHCLSSYNTKEND